MATAPDTTRRSVRAAAWWFAAAAFVLGVAVGAVIVGLLSEGSGDRQTTTAGDTTTAATAATEPRGTASSVAASGQVTVNQACLDAVTAAQAAYTAINDIAQAAQQLNAGKLDEIVRSLQPLQAQLTDNVDACNITATLPDGDPAPATAGPASTTELSAPSGGSEPTN